MDNKVYYGEYSLKHWINLILKKNITLPEYQRYFVWNERKVETLIETFKNKEFVPPVTIGAFKKNDTNENYILDGQQRITSILLAYLGLYPDVQTYKKTIELFASDNDESDEEDNTFDNILEWNVAEFTKRGNSKKDILSGISEGNYKEVDFNIDDDFLENNFLGFSYLVPQTSCEREQQKYYSSVFRNINIQGETLLPQESRASLYFLDQNLRDLFAPIFCNRIQIKLVNSITSADFIRYLSLIAQYYNDGNENKIARGYKQKMEKYYEEYIYTAISDETSTIYGKFSNVFPNKEYTDPLNSLEEALNELGICDVHKSIVDVDTYLFGLVYHIVYKNKKIDLSRKDQLKQSLNRKITVFKKNTSHQKSPNNLGHLRERIRESVSIYGRYLSHEA
jgi:uncharacterized protein with ParB-like and HNH nuclease domain